MKILRLLFAALLIAAATAAETKDADTVPSMPTEVTLTSGHVLRNVQVVRWEKDRVVLKYSGGVDPIAFSLIEEPARSQILAFKKEQEKPLSERHVAKTITGQVFVTTRGAGAYKFAGATVWAYPMKYFDNLASAQKSRVVSKAHDSSDFGRALSQIEAWNECLASVKSVGNASTDADGKFTLKLFSNEEVFLFCWADRLAYDRHEADLWVLPAHSENMVLSEENLWE